MIHHFKKILLILLALNAHICASSDQYLRIPREFKEIQCEIRPAAKMRDKKLTRPHVPVKEGTSNNWSGYVAAPNLAKPTKNSVSAVSGTWVVPTILHASSNTFCSIWVGIDGYGSPSVEQIGTEHDWSGGKQVHYAWFEMYPQYPYEINGFPVNPGDSISASVTYAGNNTFVMTIVNNTRKVFYNVPTAYTKSTTAQRVCAEWVVEAPWENGVLPLSNFGLVSWGHCTADINNVTGPINNKTWKDDFLIMVTDANAPKANPSALTANGQGFSVSWKHQ